MSPSAGADLRAAREPAVGGGTAFTGQKLAQSGSNWHKIHPAHRWSLVISHLESNISVERVVPIRPHLCQPWFCVIRCQGREHHSEGLRTEVRRPAGRSSPRKTGIIEETAHTNLTRQRGAAAFAAREECPAGPCPSAGAPSLARGRTHTRPGAKTSTRRHGLGSIRLARFRRYFVYKSWIPCD